MPIFYHSHYLGDQPVRLINVEDKFLLATIAVRQIDDALIAQMKARLRQLDKKLGVVANFHGAQLDFIVVRRGERE